MKPRLLTTDDVAKLLELATFEADEGPLDCDLYGYAASDALKTLHENWRAAQHDTGPDDPHPFTTASVLSDIDDTIAALKAYRAAAEQALG